MLQGQNWTLKIVSGFMAAVAAANTLRADEPAKPVTQTTSGPATSAPTVPGTTLVLKPGEVPKLKFESAEYTFPRTPIGRDVYHEFLLTNEGNGPLEIVNVRPTCGCTTAGEYEKIIPPGSKGKIPLRINTSNLTAGPISKTVTIVTNMPAPESIVQVTMKGEIWEPLACVPKTIGFGRVALTDTKGPLPVQKVTIQNNATVPAKLENIRFTHPNFKGEVVVLEPGKKFEIQATLVPPFQGGVINGTLEVDTGIAEMPRLMLPLSAYLAADVEVFPTRLPLPANRKNDLQRTIAITNNASKPVKLGKIICSSPALKTKVEEVRPGKAFKITLDIPKTYNVGKGGDFVSIETDSEYAPKLLVTIADAKMGGSAIGAPVDMGAQPPPPSIPGLGPETGK